MEQVVARHEAQAFDAEPPDWALGQGPSTSNSESYHGEHPEGP